MAGLCQNTTHNIYHFILYGGIDNNNFLLDLQVGNSLCKSNRMFYLPQNMEDFRLEPQTSKKVPHHVHIDSDACFFLFYVFNYSDPVQK